MNSNDIATLVEMKKAVESETVQSAVKAAEIHNPAKEVENSLTSFLIARLDRLQQDSDFANLIRMNLRQRMSEASFDQLMALLHQTSQDNNQAEDNLLKLFRNETSGKIVTDHLKSNEASSAAAQLYDTADSKELLQSITYLGQIINKLPEMNKIASDSEN